MPLHAMALVLTLMLFAATTAEAQWLNYPTAGIPRLADGKPDLNAPAPRTADGKPDLSGIWRTPTGKYLTNLAADGVEVLMHPWAEQLHRRRLANEGRDRPSAACLPHSVTDFDAHFTPKKVLQLPGLVVMLFESYRSYRQIHTDGRPLPPEPREPSWLGYSVGEWEGNTLVVETAGVNEKTWLDDSGHPHSDALRIIERFQRPNFGRMDVQVTIDDPKTYVKPWTARFYWEFVADTELLDWVCENNRYFDIIPKPPSSAR
jgi:hypothetical protein